jgi:hypothetical protein
MGLVIAHVSQMAVGAGDAAELLPRCPAEEQMTGRGWDVAPLAASAAPHARKGMGTTSRMGATSRDTTRKDSGRGRRASPTGRSCACSWPTCKVATVHISGEVRSNGLD